jgi:alpha-L-rhamnosidase
MRKKSRVLLVVLGMMLAFWSKAKASAAVTVMGLQYEYRSEPLGIDAWQPRLGWKMNARERDQHQTAYQVLVAFGELIANQDVEAAVYIVPQGRRST